MKLSREFLKELIKEEMFGLAGPNKADPYRHEELTQQEIREKIVKASRILEDLPLEDLPEAVTSAAQNLRDVLDIMPIEEDV